GDICYFICCITFYLFFFPHFYHHWINVITLTRKYIPVITISGIRVTPMSYMPSAYQGSVVSIFLQYTLHCRLPAVTFLSQRFNSIRLVVGSCKDRCPTWRTNRVRTTTIIETHAFISDSI